MGKEMPRWEKKYKQYKEESANYEELRKEIEKLEGKKTGDFKSKEKYEKAVANRDKGINEKKESANYKELRKEIKELEGKIIGDFKSKEEYEKAVATRNKEINEKKENLKKYDNFKKNEKQIENILEYRNILQGELDKLPQDNKESIEKKKAEIEKNKGILAEQENLLGDLENYIKSNPESKDVEEKREALEITSAVVGILKEQKGKLDGELEQLESEQKAYQEKATYERKIAKCNLIAANLLKGKSLDEIEIRVEEDGKRFTSKDGKLKEEVEQARNEDKSNEENMVKNNIVAEKEEEKIVNNDTVTQNAAEQIADKAYVKEESVNDEKSDVVASEEKGLVEKKSFLSRMWKKITSIFKRKDKTTQEELDKVFESVASENKEIEELFKDVPNEEKNVVVEKAEKETKDFNKENEFLKQIAEKGEKAAFEERREAFRERLAQRKLYAANEYAKKYGGRYEEQDGATAKKVETPEKEDQER